jgi:hypothetical protein
LRAAQRFSPPDALIVATGLATQVGHLVTNDRAWARKLASLGARIWGGPMPDFVAIIRRQRSEH